MPNLNVERVKHVHCFSIAKGAHTRVPTKMFQIFNIHYHCNHFFHAMALKGGYIQRLFLNQCIVKSVKGQFG